MPQELHLKRNLLVTKILGSYTLLATTQDKRNAHIPCYVCLWSLIDLPTALASLGWWADLHSQVPGAPWKAVTVGEKWKVCSRCVLVDPWVT